jgi:hypothetical protein
MRSLAHWRGALKVRHQWRNRAILTIVMFHRVVEGGTAATVHADPTYTISPRLFSICLDFLAGQYTVVTLDQVLGSRAGDVPLPPRSLLITFDDG